MNHRQQRLKPKLVVWLVGWSIKILQHFFLTIISALSVVSKSCNTTSTNAKNEQMSA